MPESKKDSSTYISSILNDFHANALPKKVEMGSFAIRDLLQKDKDLSKIEAEFKTFINDKSKYFSGFSDSGELIGSILGNDIAINDIKNSFDEIYDKIEDARKKEITKATSDLLTAFRLFQRDVLKKNGLSINRALAKELHFLCSINEDSSDADFDRSVTIINYFDDLLKNASNPDNLLNPSDGIGKYITGRKYESIVVDNLIHLNDAAQTYKPKLSISKRLSRAFSADKDLQNLNRREVEAFLKSASSKVFEVRKITDPEHTGETKEVIKNARLRMLSEFEATLIEAVKLAMKDDDIGIKNINSKTDEIEKRVNEVLKKRKNDNSSLDNFFKDFFKEVKDNDKHKSFLQLICFNVNQTGSKEAAKKHNAFSVMADIISKGVLASKDSIITLQDPDFSRLEKLKGERSDKINEKLDRVADLFNGKNEYSDIEVKRYLDAMKAEAEHSENVINKMTELKAGEISSEFSTMMKNWFYPLKDAKEAVVVIDNESKTLKHGLKPRFFHEYRLDYSDEFGQDIIDNAFNAKNKDIEPYKSVINKYCEFVKQKRFDDKMGSIGADPGIFDKQRLALTSSWQMAAIDSKEHKAIEQFQATDFFKNLQRVMMASLNSIGLGDDCYDFKVGLNFVDFDKETLQEKYKFDFFLVGKNGASFCLSEDGDIKKFEAEVKKKITNSIKSQDNFSDLIDKVIQSINNTAPEKKIETEEKRKHAVSMAQYQNTYKDGQQVIQINPQSHANNEEQKKKEIVEIPLI